MCFDSFSLCLFPISKSYQSSCWTSKSKIDVPMSAVYEGVFLFQRDFSRIPSNATDDWLNKWSYFTENYPTIWSGEGDGGTLKEKTNSQTYCAHKKFIRVEIRFVWKCIKVSDKILTSQLIFLFLSLFFFLFLMF